jgi:hypothetical protein
MSKLTDIRPAKADGDLVLREAWRAKDLLSSAYGHDVHRLFAETRAREELSGHPLLSLADLKQPANRLEG